MRVVVTAPRSELGRLVTRRRAGEPEAGAAVVLNLALQTPNTLLHDGRAWWRDPAAHIVTSTATVLADAQRNNAAFLVHAGYAFLDGVRKGGTVGTRMAEIAAAAREAERMVLGGVTPACVVRVGYLYSPEWHDLRAYRRAFRLRRPYWSGPQDRLQHHVHADDAVTALLAAARLRSAGRVSYATDGTPVSFADFLDHFAHLVGCAHPHHIPERARRVSHLFVRETHMQMVEMAVAGRASPQQAGWQPRFNSYQEGLADAVATWGSGH